MSAKRQIVILQKLTEDKSCTIKQLSLLCDVSYKTVQNEIKNINNIFKRKGFQTSISFYI